MGSGVREGSERDGDGRHGARHVAKGWPGWGGGEAKELRDMGAEVPVQFSTATTRRFSAKVRTFILHGRNLITILLVSCEVSIDDRSWC